MLKQIKRHNLILIVIAAVLLFGNVVFLWTKYQASFEPTFSADAMKKHPLFVTKVNSVVDDVQLKARDLPEGSFSSSGEEAEEILSKFFDSVRTSDLFRMKIWDKNYTVIWSNATETIGKSFPDNHEVTEAYQGEREVEVKSNVKVTEKSESFTERSFSNYAEVYIPIKDSSDKVVGVAETYIVTEDVVTQLRSDFYKSAALSVGVSVVIFVAAFLALRFI